MLGGVEILLGHHHSLLNISVLYFYLRYHCYNLEEVLVDGHTVLLGHQHLSVLTLLLQHHEVKGEEDVDFPLPWHKSTIWGHLLAFATNHMVF